MSLQDKLIINAAITGMVPTRKDTPHIPLTPEEIAADVRRCREAGAAIVHLHARDASSQPTFHKDVYHDILTRVRAVCPDIILCVSTSGRVFKEFHQRSEVLDTNGPRPEMASLTLGSMNFAREESINSPEMIKALAIRMLERSVVPELECFELGMVEYASYLISHGILRPPFYCNLLLGNLGTLSATPDNLAAMVRALPPHTTWAAAGIGRFQLDVNTLAINTGGHIRVGLEDNLYFDRERHQLATNPQLITRLAQIAKTAGRELATPAEARQIIGLPSPQP